MSKIPIANQILTKVETQFEMHELVQDFELSEDMISFTFSTSKGLVDFLSEFEITDNEKTLHLKDITIYPQSKTPITGITSEILKIRRLLIKMATDLNYEYLRITAIRVETSTSANPGHSINSKISLSYNCKKDDIT